MHFWLEYPDKNQTKIQTIDEISKIIIYNCKARKYIEKSDNFEIRVIGYRDNSLLLDTKDIFKNITNGLKFYLFFNETFEYSGEEILVPTQNIALIEIFHVGEISKGKIVQEFNISSPNKEKLENVKNGLFEGIRGLLKVKFDEDFENASSVDLKTILELIIKVKVGAIK